MPRLGRSSRGLLLLLFLCAVVMAQVESLAYQHPHPHSGTQHCCARCHTGPLSMLQTPRRDRGFAGTDGGMDRWMLRFRSSPRHSAVRRLFPRASLPWLLSPPLTRSQSEGVFFVRNVCRILLAPCLAVFPCSGVACAGYRGTAEPHARHGGSDQGAGGRGACLEEPARGARHSHPPPRRKRRRTHPRPLNWEAREARPPRRSTRISA